MYSPLIKDGALSIDEQGLLIDAPDIQTQMTVTVSAYNCMYDSNVESQLIPYLTSIPVNGWSSTAIINIISSAYKLIMIPLGLIYGLKIATSPLTPNTIQIKINATDKEGASVSLNWINP